MTDMPDPFREEPLSAGGRRRSEAILADAIAVGRRRQRVRVVRRAAFVAVPLLTALIVASVMRPTSHPAVRPMTAVLPPTSRHDLAGTTKPTPRVAPNVLITSTAAVRIERIVDDPTIVARYAMSQTAKRFVEPIDDAQLFKELAAANLRGGLATIGGHTRLVLSR